LTQAGESLHDLVHEDPKKVVSINQAEDREQVRKMSQDLQGKNDVESLELMTSLMKVKKESTASDARPEAGNTSFNSHSSSLIDLSSSSSESDDDRPLS